MKRKFSADKKENLLKHDLRGDELGLTTQEELEIFCLLIDKFIYPLLKLEKPQVSERSEETVDKEKKFRCSDCHKHLNDFVKKHPAGYTKEDFFDLKFLMQAGSYSFNDNELKRLINLEIKEHSYAAFKNTMEANSPKNFNEYLKRFVEAYGGQFKILKDFKETRLILKDKSLSRGEIQQQIKRKNIEFNTIKDMISNFTEKRLENIKSLAERALKIVFLKKLLSENNIEIKLTNNLAKNNEELIDLIIRETQKR